jgi:hypothetical protein
MKYDRIKGGYALFIFMAESTKNTKSKKKPESDIYKEVPVKEVPLTYIIPDDVPLLFSDGMVVQHSENEFILSFFQTNRPIVLSEEDANKVTKAESRCVVRIVVTPRQMERNAKAMVKNFDSWVEKIRLLAGDDNAGNE